MQRINIKDLRSLPSLYIALSADGSAHLLLNASASLPEAPSTKNKTGRTPSTPIGEKSRKHVELLSRPLALDQWIQVDVSLSPTGGTGMASRDLYDLSLLLDGQLDVSAIAIFRGLVILLATHWFVYH